MNKGKQRIGICFMTAIMLVAVSISILKLDVRAGFGDFNDYSDSGSDYSSDYSSDSSDWDSDWDSEWEVDVHGDGFTVSTHHNGNVGTIFIVSEVIFFMFAILMISIRILAVKSRRRRSSAVGGSQRILPDRTDEISRIIQERDTFFTAPDFLSFARQVYMDIQSAWEKRDLGPVRGVLHQNLYQQTNRQIQEKIEEGIVNHLERISINTAYLTSYRRDREYEYLTIYLAASMIDYQVKEATGEIILGDKTTRWNLQYKMTFMRSTDAKTRSAKEADRGFVCPNCGAPLKGTSFGECEYCGSVVTTGAYDWVLSSFGVVKNDTVDEGIKVN